MKPTDDRIESKVKIYETYAKGIIIAGLVGIAIAVFALVRNGLIIPSAKFDFKLLGDLGGLIAGISGLFALGGVLLYYSALKLQAKALFLQREDIELNREALKAQLKEFKNQVKEQQLTREVFLEQSKTQKLQQFESTFTLLSNNLNNEREKLRSKFIASKNSDPNKRESYFWWYASQAINDVNSKLATIHIRFPDVDDDSEFYIEKINQHIDKYIIQNIENVKVYLSTLELLIDFVNDGGDENKIFFLRILKSGMNEWEFKWLYLYSFYYISNRTENYNDINVKLLKAEIFNSEYLIDFPFKVLKYYFNTHNEFTSPQTNQ